MSERMEKNQEIDEALHFFSMHIHIQMDPQKDKVDLHAWEAWQIRTDTETDILMHNGA